MTVEEQVRAVLRDVLSLGDRVDRLTPGSALLGSVPELDSMAVVTLAVNLEREFDFEIDDEDFTGEVFETIGTLAEFVEQNKR